MQEHLKYYCTQNQILTGLENEMDDHDLTFLVLFSLPWNLSWQNIVSTIIETTPSITFNSVESQLLCQVEVLQLDNPATPPLMNTLRAGTIALAASNEAQCANCLRRSLTHKSEDCYSAGGPKQHAKTQTVKVPVQGEPTSAAQTLQMRAVYTWHLSLTSNLST